MEEEYQSPEIKVYEIHPHPILCASAPIDDNWHHHDDFGPHGGWDDHGRHCNDGYI